MFIPHDFNLLLPTQKHFLASIQEFNKLRAALQLPLYVTEVEEDDFETYLFSPEGEPETHVEGEIILPPADMTFRVHKDIKDDTPGNIAYNFVEFLCEKFTGTMVGVYVKEKELIPIKIINGKRIPCSLVLIDDAGFKNDSAE